MGGNGAMWATVLWVATAGTALSVGGGTFRLRLLHTNDMHARFEQVSQSAGKCSEYEAATGRCYGGFARMRSALAGEIAKAQRENVSFVSLNAGDTYQGTVWFAVYKWRVVSHFLKMLQLDAMSLGNHEFDDGIMGLSPFLKDVGIPTLAANIDLAGEPEMATTPLKKQITLEKGGRRIGVIGYLTPDTVTLADTGKLKFRSEIESLTEEAKRLRAAGVNIIIALGHSGYEVDSEIARQVPDVDVVVGGHSHTFLYTGTPPDSERPTNKYPVFVTQASGRKVAMVQAYAFTKYLGVLDLTFDEDGELKEASGNPILLDAKVPEDPLVLKEIKAWQNKLNESLGQALGKTKVFLDASQCRFRECNLGNLITDAYVHHGVKSHPGPFWTKAAIAIQQAGGIRTSINATSNNGTVTREDVITSMPFFSTLSVVSIKGKHLREALEWSVTRYDPNLQLGRGEFLQVSGLKVEFDLNRPAGSRLVSVRARCSHCHIPRFQPLLADAEYDVIMPTFLFNGGDRFTVFKVYGKEISRFDTSDTDVTMRYIEERGVVYDGLQDRIQFRNTAIILKPRFIYLFIISWFRFL